MLVGKRSTLIELPGDYDANADNIEKDGENKGKLRTDRRPVPQIIKIRKGLRLHLTRNVDKEGDFVNGMEVEIKSWDESSRCLRVRSVTGKDIPVFQYTDPNPEAQNCSFFPIRLGYASTVYKLQGAELPHATIWLDIPHQRAAAYVAMSRVKEDGDYLFGGHYTKHHFVPNN